MKTALDALGRRDRYKRNPEGKKTAPNSRDITWFSFLHRHGGRLPTSYLYDATKDTHRSFQATSLRLKRHYHETKLIDRPWQQQETIDPRYNELVHELNDRSVQVLKDEGLFSNYAPSPHGAFKHQVMLSCISASFELNAKKLGITYTPQHEILEAVGHDHSIDIQGDKVTPDLVFALTIEGKKVLCFLEVDRGTEATSSENLNRKSWKRSVRQYKELIGSGLYKKHYGVDCGALLFVVTISNAKVEGIKKVIAEEGGANYILLHHIPEFGRVFHPPKVLDMLGVSWERSGAGVFRLT